MQALKFRATIDEKRTLSLALPSGVRPGPADVIVLLDEKEPSVAPPSKRSPAEALEALMRFGDGRRLDGLSIKEMAAEGRP